MDVLVELLSPACLACVCRGGDACAAAYAGGAEVHGLIGWVAAATVAGVGTWAMRRRAPGQARSAPVEREATREDGASLPGGREAAP